MRLFRESRKIQAINFHFSLSFCFDSSRVARESIERKRKKLRGILYHFLSHSVAVKIELEEKKF